MSNDCNKKLEWIIESIRQKIKLCGDRTMEERARKGAYVDCIVMLKEQMNEPDSVCFKRRVEEDY